MVTHGLDGHVRVQAANGHEGAQPPGDVRPSVGPAGGHQTHPDASVQSGAAEGVVEHWPESAGGGGGV